MNTSSPTRFICLCLLAILWAEPVLAREPNRPAPSPSAVEPAPLTPPPPPPAQPWPGYSTPTQSVPDPYQPAVWSRRPRRKVGLLIGGVATLVASYAISALVGVQLLSTRCDNCNTAGPALLIPIAGPWVALPYANAATGGQVFSAVLGIAQAVGLGLTIGGVIVFMNSGRPAAPAGKDFSMSFSPLPGGAVAAFGGRF